MIRIYFGVLQLHEKTDDNPIKRMADLLSHGAALTDLSCPACSSPLFRLKDATLWCAKCEKKVIVVKEGEEQEKASNATYNRLEATLLKKVQEISFNTDALAPRGWGSYAIHLNAPTNG